MGLKPLLLDLVEVGIAGQFEPHDIARFSILTSKGISHLIFFLTVFIEADYAHVVVIGEEFLCSLPEAIFNVCIHGATGIAIDEDGVFGGLWHIEHLFRLAPCVELHCHIAGGLCEIQTDVVTITEAQLVAHQLPFGFHRLPILRAHGQRSVGRSRIGKIDLLNAEGFAI